MPRIRTIKPEAFQSETLAEVSLAAERTFFGLSTQVDDRGRISDKPAQINGLLWAMRGNHTATDTDAELSELEKAGLVCRYMGCDERRYLHLVTWDDHQRVDHPSKSRLPRCPDHGDADYCGRHDGDCHPRDPLASPREPSRQDRGPRTVDHGPTEATPPPRSRAPREPVANPQPAAQAIVGEWIDHCRKRPPDRVVAQTAKQVKTLLGEGIDPEDVRRGLSQWHARGLDPSVLPSVVNQVMNGAGKSRRQAATDEMFDRAMRRAEAKENHDTEGNSPAHALRQRMLPAAGDG